MPNMNRINIEYSFIIKATLQQHKINKSMGLGPESEKTRVRRIAVEEAYHHREGTLEHL